MGFMMIFISILAMQHGVLGARLLSEKVEVDKPQVWNRSPINGDEGFFATVNREVPSSPDPLHNK